jgi:hypothetical protein
MAIRRLRAIQNAAPRGIDAAIIITEAKAGGAHRTDVGNCHSATDTSRTSSAVDRTHAVAPNVGRRPDSDDKGDDLLAAP